MNFSIFKKQKPIITVDKLIIDIDKRFKALNVKIKEEKIKESRHKYNFKKWVEKLLIEFNENIAKEIQEWKNDTLKKHEERIEKLLSITSRKFESQEHMMNNLKLQMQAISEKIKG